MRNNEIAKLLRSAASALLNGHRATAKKKVEQANDELNGFVGREDEPYPAYRARALADAVDRNGTYEDWTEPGDRLEAILADARHYADTHNLDYDAALRTSYGMYAEDLTR